MDWCEKGDDRMGVKNTFAKIGTFLSSEDFAVWMRSKHTALPVDYDVKLCGIVDISSNSPGVCCQRHLSRGQPSVLPPPP